MDNTLLCAIHRERDNVEMKELKKITKEIIALVEKNITPFVLSCLFTKSLCVICGIEFDIWYGVFATFSYAFFVHFANFMIG